MIEHIATPTKLYRVGKRDASRQGLWYDGLGRETGIILTLGGTKAASLPMGPHPYFRLGGRHWISATDSLDGLKNWFSPLDCQKLVARGYDLLEIVTTAHLHFHFEDRGYSHEVFCQQEVTSVNVLDFDRWIGSRALEAA